MCALAAAGSISSSVTSASAQVFTSSVSSATSSSLPDVPHVGGPLCDLRKGLVQGVKERVRSVDPPNDFSELILNSIERRIVVVSEIRYVLGPFNPLVSLFIRLV